MSARNDFDLTGKIAVITGGTGALGSVMARGLAAAGADVVPVDGGFAAANGIRITSNLLP